MENQFLSSEEKSIQLNSISLDYIKETARWAKFIAIIGFIGVGFLVLLALFMGYFLPTLNQTEGLNQLPSFMGPFLSLIYIAIAALYFVPVLYLFKFSAKTLKAIELMDEVGLENGFNNLRRHFKFIGILVIIMVAFYVLAILGGFLGGVLSSL